MSAGDAGQRVGCAGTGRANAHRKATPNSGMGRRHERCAALVLGEHEPDLAPFLHGLEERRERAPRDAEDVLHALGLEQLEDGVNRRDLV